MDAQMIPQEFLEPLIHLAIRTLAAEASRRALARFRKRASSAQSNGGDRAPAAGEPHA